MKTKIFSYDKQESREIDTQFLTLTQWVKANFCGWGFYEVVRVSKNVFEVKDRFTKELKYRVG